nr:hypothetical protein [Mesorhizobium sp. L2C054A000]
MKELTDEFKATGNSVWRNRQIVEPLLASSFGKCAYCECRLTEESKYVEVEHFLNKNDFPDLVVKWINLLPACKRCNASKSTHDVGTSPIINPYEDTPKNHVTMRFYRMVGLDEKGDTTIDVVSLNDTDRATTKRFQIGEQLHSNIADIGDKLEKFISEETVIRRNKLVSAVRNLLRECQRKAEYAATAATIVVNDQKFLKVLAAMQGMGLWSAELSALHEEANDIAL